MISKHWARICVHQAPNGAHRATRLIAEHCRCKLGPGQDINGATEGSHREPTWSMCWCGKHNEQQEIQRLGKELQYTLDAIYPDSISTHFAKFIQMMLITEERIQGRRTRRSLCHGHSLITQKEKTHHSEGKTIQVQTQSGEIWRNAGARKSPRG